MPQLPPAQVREHLVRSGQPPIVQPKSVVAQIAFQPGVQMPGELVQPSRVVTLVAPLAEKPPSPHYVEGLGFLAGAGGVVAWARIGVAMFLLSERSSMLGWLSK